jgi:hypothetical protein
VIKIRLKKKKPEVAPIKDAPEPEAPEEEQVYTQEVEVNMSLLNRKLNMVIAMVDEIKNKLNEEFE